MNTKLLSKVLSNAGYTNPEQISQIVNATPNPTVALEMLLGIYQPIDIGLYYKRGDSRYFVVQVNELHDQVHYKEYSRKTRQVWAMTKEDWDNKRFVTEKPKGNYHDYTWVPDTGYTMRENSTSLKDFLDRYTLTTDVEFATTIEFWNNTEEMLPADL